MNMQVCQIYTVHLYVQTNVNFGLGHNFILIDRFLKKWKDEDPHPSLETNQTQSPFIIKVSDSDFYIINTLDFAGKGALP